MDLPVHIGSAEFIILLLLLFVNNTFGEMLSETDIDVVTEYIETQSQEIVFEETTTTPTSTGVSSAEEFGVGTTLHPLGIEYELKEFIKTPTKKCDCGLPKFKYSPGFVRVIGGQPARDGEFPWFAAITRFQHNKQPRWKVVCGATLIGQGFVITAAHCLHKRFKETLQVVFNVKDTHNITTDLRAVRRKIEHVLIHPGYNATTQHNDIALIQLKMPPPIRGHGHGQAQNLENGDILPICLPSRVAEKAYKNGTVAGFGHTAYGSGTTQPKENSRVLMKVHVPILSHAECLKSKVPTKKNITESMICAGSQGKDACINDSGAPLMAQENGKTVIVGVASFGIGCALPGYPGVYTKVSKYTEWIRKMVASASSTSVSPSSCHI